MRILSVNPGHDAAAVILNDGEIEYYYKEERLSKRKRDKMPFLSIIECINHCKGKIDYVVSNTQGSVRPYEYELYYLFLHKVSKVPYENILDISLHHHLSHAGIAFYNSGFDKCLVVVVDGEGSKFEDTVSECESVYIASYPDNFTPILKNFYRNPSYVYRDLKYQYKDIKDFQNLNQKLQEYYKCECNFNGNLGGIVTLYSSAAEIITQSSLENGKPMGLSSYGEKIKDFPSFFTTETGAINDDLFYLCSQKDIDKTIYKPYKNKITKEITKENYKFYADYAYEIQTQTQEAVGNLIEKSIEKTGIKKVCVVGGYGMNIVANYYYLQRFPDVEFYFEPLSDDTGITIGTAKVVYHRETKDKTIRPLKTTSFHGVPYDISQYKGKTTSTENIAQLLYQNKSVGVYTGLAEAGQRALGNRSILFNALNPDAKELVNKIKNREWYRPFACMVLEEDAGVYFNMGQITSSPFMTICFPVRLKYVKIIPGVTHADNTCRIQTVSQEDEYLYKLLNEFKKLSGHGIVLNTSFNLAGEPLVETPEDAFNTLNNSCLDYLWFEETQQLFKNKKLVSINYQ
jgi:carbamoyltransferase